MTRIPWESWLVQAWPEMPPYELNTVCAHPSCSSTNVEDHHIWRRSFGKDFRDAWWVRLEDDRTAPNRVGLCPFHHAQITTNAARLEFVDLENDELVCMWIEGDSGSPLDPQPSKGAPAGTGLFAQLTVEGGEVSHEHVCEERAPDETCPRCRGKGRVKARKRSEPAQKGTRKATWSCRVPAHERENGHEVLEQNMETVVDILHRQGLIRDPDRGANYYALVYVLVDFIQRNRTDG